MSSRADSISLRALSLRGPRSIHWQIARAILLVGALTFAAKLAVIAKESLVARQFGTGDALDAFFIALLLPSFAATVISSGFQSAFLPAYVQVREREGHAEAERLLAGVLTAAAALLLALTIVCYLFSGPLLRALGAGFQPEKLALTRALFYVLLPTLFITGIASIWAAALNAGERFAVVAAAPILTPAIVIGSLLWRGPTWGIYAVAGATVLGAVVETAVIGSWVWRHYKKVVFGWHGFTPAVRQVGRQLAPMLAGAFFMSSSTFIDQTMAARLGPGSVSTLNFGSRLVTGALGISSVALGTAVFPHFARMIAGRELARATSVLKTYAALILALSLPVLAVFLLYSPAIVSLLFQHGSFTQHDTQVVSRVQIFFALQIPFYLLGLLGVRFISSLNGNHLLLIIGAVSALANVVGNAVLMHIYGVAGIALSTTLVYALSCILIGFSIRLLMRRQATTEIAS